MNVMIMQTLADLAIRLEPMQGPWYIIYDGIRIRYMNEGVYQ